MVVDLPGGEADRSGQGGGSWTFLTSHARVLIYIAQNPRARIQDVATSAEITERAALAIVNDLVEDGYVKRSRIGQGRRYTVNRHRPFRHPVDAHHTVAELLALFTSQDDSSAS